MTEQRLSLGRWGEEQAVNYLKRRLYRIVATNYRRPTGEIDIIARRGKTLAFIEVKTRRSRQFGAAQEAVTPRKQRQIIRTAQYYVIEHCGERDQMRFDVIAIHVDGDKPRIDHLVNAFEL
ncbi:MAG: YraN family protein [Desulfuromonas sp.]|nr:YraN family protein [Desulfuromonas sp.]